MILLRPEEMGGISWDNCYSFPRPPLDFYIFFSPLYIYEFTLRFNVLLLLLNDV